jgi:hypothetical protein
MTRGRCTECDAYVTPASECDCTGYTDEAYDADGRAYPRGRCDTCGAPCADDTGDCTSDPTHETALEG